VGGERAEKEGIFSVHQKKRRGKKKTAFSPRSSGRGGGGERKGGRALDWKDKKKGGGKREVIPRPRSLETETYLYSRGEISQFSGAEQGKGGGEKGKSVGTQQGEEGGGGDWRAERKTGRRGEGMPTTLAFWGEIKGRSYSSPPEKKKK